MTKKQYNLLVQAHNELEKLSKACPDDACDSETLSTAADALEEVLFQASDKFEEQPSEDDYDFEEVK